MASRSQNNGIPFRTRADVGRQKAAQSSKELVFIVNRLLASHAYTTGERGGRREELTIKGVGKGFKTGGGSKV
jgi:hypothetical protein